MCEDNFPTQLGSEPTRGAALLDLLLTNREGLVGDTVVGAILSTETMTKEFLILRGVNKTLDFQSADFVLFRTLVQTVPWQ